MFEANLMKILSLAILAAATLVSAAPALAANTATYTLTTIDPTVAPGGSFTFDGTLTALSSNAGNLDIYTDTGNLSCTDCTIDDTDLFVDAPAVLTPGQSYTGPLFTVTTTGTDAGTYDGNFDIGLENNAAGKNAFTLDAPFSLTVGSPASVTPEPASWLLLGTGLAAVGLLRRRLLTSAVSA